MFSGRRSARSGPGVLGAVPASGATGDGLIGSAIGKTRSLISGNIPVLPEQIPVAAAPSRNLSESLAVPPATALPPQRLTWNHPPQASLPVRAASATARGKDRAPQNP